ncbi:MAG: hypothetical protein EXR72_24210 [Myxococcales bacterium]|nr:hypothetical protein [Myxococcales bacterium]
MALDLTPLDDRRLPEAVRRVVAGPAPMKLMAARGLAALAPPDLAVLLYQLAEPWAIEGDGQPVLEDTAVTARKTAGELPDGVLAGALARDLDSRVLDFFARKIAGRPKLLHTILFNRAVADETFAHLASVCGEAELILIARNEQRLLAHPPIVAALYLNRKTPMSVAIRAVELAIRNGVPVDGIPGFDELKASLDAAPDREAIIAGAEDAAFNVAAMEGEGMQDLKEPVEDAEGEGEAEEVDQPGREVEEKRNVPIGSLSIPGKIRLATLGNAFARSVLVRDSNRVVALAAISSPQMGDNEVAKYSANRALSEDVIRYIARQRNFTRLYLVKLNLVNNPKATLSTTIGYLPFLTMKDLRVVARSKSIPGPLVKAAAVLLQKKQK